MQVRGLPLTRVDAESDADFACVVGVDKGGGPVHHVEGHAGGSAGAFLGAAPEGHVDEGDWVRGSPTPLIAPTCPSFSVILAMRFIPDPARVQP